MKFLSVLKFKNFLINFFNEQYYRYSLSFLIMIIIGILIYLTTNINYPLKLNLIILLIIFFIIVICQVFSEYIDSKHYLKISYLLYLFKLAFFLVLGFSIINFHINYFYKFSLLNKKFYIKYGNFIIYDVVKYDFKKPYICFLLKDYGLNHIDPLDKNCSFKFCTHNHLAINLNIGDTINIQNFFLQPMKKIIHEYDYDIRRSYFFRKIIATAYSNNITQLDNQHFSINLWQKFLLKTNRYRFSKAKKIIQDFGENIGGIIAALIYGSRIFINQSWIESMQKSSTMHLIAISGMHISFVSLVFFKFFIRLIIAFSYLLSMRTRIFTLNRIALYCSLLAGFTYLIFSGFSISGQRAFVMFFIGTICIFIKEQVIFYKIISLSIFILLLIQPYEILNPGLQMSILAVVALFWINSLQLDSKLYQLLSSKTNFTPWINKFMQLCTKNLCWIIAPHLLTLPISIFYFGQLTTFSIIANFFAIPLMSVAIAPLIIAYFTCPVYFINLKNFFHYCLEKSITLLEYIADFFAELKFGFYFTPQISKQSFILIVLGLIWLIIWLEKFKYIGLLLILIGIYLSFQNTWPTIFIHKNSNSQINILFAHKNNIYNLDQNQKIDHFLKRKFLKENKNIVNLNLCQSLKHINCNNTNLRETDLQINLNNKLSNLFNKININQLSKKLQPNQSYSIYITKNQNIIIKHNKDFLINKPWHI